MFALPKPALTVIRWVGKHRKNIVHGVIVAGGAVAAQPAFHALLHGDKVGGAALIAGVLGVLAAYARQRSVK